MHRAISSFAAYFMPCALPVLVFCMRIDYAAQCLHPVSLQNPYLELTGPVRAVLLSGHVIFEASLYVKGATRSDDKELSLLAITSLGVFNDAHSYLIEHSYTSRLSTLELMLGYLTYSVEATIEVRVICGTWPADGFRFIFEANAGIGQWIVLLETAETADVGDKISLARQVVSVDYHRDRELKVVATITNGSATYTDEKGFKPLKMGASSKELSIGGLGLQVTVYWSCFPFAPV
jgi:hypothetical protein